MEYDKKLPIGSVVLLKNGKKKLMITGYLTYSVDNGAKLYDYNGCAYPEGIIKSDVTFLFNHSQIEKVIYLGYKNEEYSELCKKIDVINSKESIA